MAVDFIFLIVCPYLAILLAVGVGIYRFIRDRIAFSSYSSQFLEKETLYAGSASWHYGILVVLMAHLLALLFPRFWRLLGQDPPRLWGMEMSGLILAGLALIGLGILMVRRIVIRRIRMVTTVMDWLLEIVLMSEVTLGFLVALLYRWGSQWYLSTAVPWIVSLITLRPDVGYVASLPWLVKAHFFGAFLLVGIFPFSRLLHLATSRLSYLFRPYQTVIWHHKRRTDGRG